VAIQLTGFGGVGEIGGNAFLLEAPGLRVMLDLGKRFGSAATMETTAQGKAFPPSAFAKRPGFGDYFDSFQKVRAYRPVADLMSLGIIPSGNGLEGLYRQDLGGATTAPPVDMVLVSHAHVDHCGLIGLLRPDIPVVTSAQSQATMQSIQATGMSSWETDYVDLRVRGGLEAKETGEYTRVSYRDGEAGLQRPFRVEARLESGPWSIEHHAVDHSIQGASAFILTDGDTKVVYTGDFREHGLHPEKTRAFLKAAADPDVLIMEGTRVGHGHPDSTDKETDVEAQVRGFIETHQAQGNPPFVAVGYPPRDLDRFQSLHRVARSVGRRLLIHTKQAYLLDALRRFDAALPDWRSDPNLGVYLGASNVLEHEGHVPVADRKRLVVESRLEPEWASVASRELSAWEFRMLGGEDERRGSRRIITKSVPFGDEHIVTAANVRDEPGDYVLSLNVYGMSDLLEIFPDRSKAGGLYIHSQTQPHNDDMEMDQFRLRRWLRAFHLNAPEHEPRRTHVSGHVSQADIDAILAELRPKVLVPIHSEHPGMTKERYEARTGQKALLPEWGVPLRL
jgi:ribonuclease J